MVSIFLLLAEEKLSLIYHLKTEELLIQQFGLNLLHLNGLVNVKVRCGNCCKRPPTPVTLVSEIDEWQ